MFIVSRWVMMNKSTITIKSMAISYGGFWPLLDIKAILPFRGYHRIIAVGANK